MKSINELMNFQRVLERQFNIHKWNPTLPQLQKMWDYISAVPPTVDKSSIFFVIQEIYGQKIRCMFLGGLDTSTTSDLLAAAKAAANGHSGSRDS